MATANTEPDAATREDEMRAAIVAAARRCFARDGVRKTRMAAIAKEAGMVRQTVYLFVDSRAHLLELAMAARMDELRAEVFKRSLRNGSLVDELIDALAVMTEVMRADPECGELAEAMSPPAALRFMAGPDSEAHPVAASVLEPLYERAERESLLRPGLTLDEMAWWARNVLAPLSQRRDLSAEALRTIVRRFAIPAFLVDGH
jgi:AcrR family transcriptional regulator